MTLSELRAALIELSNRRGIPHFADCAVKYIYDCHKSGVAHWALDAIRPKVIVEEPFKLNPDLVLIGEWVDKRHGRHNEMVRTGLIASRYFTMIRNGEHFPTVAYMGKVKRAALKVAESERIRGVCSARRVNDQYVCGKCGIQWDADEDYLPACKQWEGPPKSNC